ncbi:MAG: DHHA1 domain-containing protein, partial [Desulfofundulus sp.]
SGGQVSDHALVSAPELEVQVLEVYRPVEGFIVHRGKVQNGVFKKNDSVLVVVDGKRRRDTARNHSATHLLHRALKEVLGPHVNQAGSLVEPDRLRFDFTHYAAVSGEELHRIEEMVNQAVLENLPVQTFVTSLEEARAMGAVALFGEKYGEQVRVVKMGDFSIELCGGTHVRSTAEIGLFKLISESSVGAGLRRVEAVTGTAALRYVRAREEQLARIASLVKATQAEVVHRVESLVNEVKELERESEGLRARLARYEVQSLLEQVKDLDGAKFLAARTSAPDMESLRAMVDLLRERLGSAVILLASPVGERVNLVAAVTKDLLPRGLHAGKLIKEVASMLGGGGGGRPEMAQAGGRDASRLQEALQKAYNVAAAQLKN